MSVEPTTPPSHAQPDPEDSPMLPANDLPDLAEPTGPLCSYGPRLGYTYFASPAPHQESLNAAQDSTHYFTIDDQLVYLSFFQDSGPLNAACLYRFCLHVHTLLEDPATKHKRVTLYSSDEPDKKANAALLIALYAMIVMRWTPADVLHPISCLELQPYRDAGYSRADYHLSVQSTVFGISRAISLGLLDLSTFDLAAYEKYEKVENGDWNWITPGFLAFASPMEPQWHLNDKSSEDRSAKTAKLNRSFRNVLEEFEKGGVKAIVRLNKKLYDRRHFEDRGMEHVEMYFDDGTNPTLEMTREFIALSERVFATGGAVAVHCKAGLGRTGTLIGAWLIYKHGFTASEAIGFMRLMRPGSCVGPQQHYLYENQMTYIRWGAVDAHLATQVPTPVTPTLISTSSHPIPSTSTASTSRIVQPPPSPSRKRDNYEATPRPLTPPAEDELEQSRSRHSTPAAVVPAASGSGAAPRTPPPRTPGGGAIVPGQPRKTPGKSKHSVATPEVRDADEGFDEVADVDREALMLVKEDGEEDTAMDVAETLAVQDSLTGPKSKSAATTRASREGKAVVNGHGSASASAAAASASRKILADNRPGGATSEELPRTQKATRGLGAANGPRGPGTAPNMPTRTTRSTSGTIPSSTSTTNSKPVSSSSSSNAPPPPNPVMPSPSRLPTRIPAKRRGAGPGSKNGVVPIAKTGLEVGRSVRRRKSGGAPA